MHIIAAKAVAFGEALQPEFRDYCAQIVKNAKTMAETLLQLDFKLVSGGTDTHVILVDLTDKNITGKAAERSLEAAGITVNKNMVPYDERSPMVTSGIRVGTPAMTTRGMGVDEMRQIANMIGRIISAPDDSDVRSRTRQEVKELTGRFPLYPDLRT